ncbi:polysaccharide lyase family 8 super-sandwich domain-containing protein [Paenibacillus oryzisoli]|uniref:polysaccharide lyase family 8 super-sandwich domain-containing protein n=1 Tax=Paenibacillus oryzisoli TaxID=1850517 RepID=UPI003D2B6C97
MNFRKKRGIHKFLVICMLLGGLNLFSGKSAAAFSVSDYTNFRTIWANQLTGGSFNGSDPDISARVQEINNSAVSSYNLLTKDPNTDPYNTDTRACLWTNYCSNQSPGNITVNYSQIKNMAMGYVTPGTTMYKGNNNVTSQDYKVQIMSALNWLKQNWYARGDGTTNGTTGATRYRTGWWADCNSTSCTNFYDWEIGTPLLYADTLTLMYSDLSSTTIANYTADIFYYCNSITQPPGDTTYNYSGANLVWRAQVWAVAGAVEANSANDHRMVTARDSLSEIFPYVTGAKVYDTSGKLTQDNEGFYTDGSFIAHTGHPYNGGYGVSLAGTIANLMYGLSTSVWKVVDPSQANVYKWMYDSYEALVYKGSMPAMTRGREIARFSSSDHDTAYRIIRAMAKLAQFAPEDHSANFKSMVKTWDADYAYANRYSGSTIDMIKLLKAIISDSSIPVRPDPIAQHTFAGMDRIFHRGPDFGFGVSMYSNRTLNYEAGNGENLRGWYTNAGATFLYNNDLDQYTSDYWPTINSYRIPGTTVETRAKFTNLTSGAADYYQNESNKTSDRSWVGGSDILGLYGAAGMDLHSYWQSSAANENLSAKKSSFMFEDEVVALGAGITRSDTNTATGWDGQPIRVETIVDNRKLNSAGNNTMTVGSPTTSATAYTANGTKTLIGTNQWVHLAGNTSSGSDIGYVFPGAATVSTYRETRSDAWSSINQNSSFSNIATKTNNFLNIFFNHNSAPSNASYSYILLPNYTVSQVSDYAANLPSHVTIVENSTSAQAVKQNMLNLEGINFWSNGTYTVDGVTSSTSASVMIKESSQDIELSVSDPTQLNTAGIDIEVAGRGGAAELVEGDPEITVTQWSPTIKFQVATNASSQGKSYHVKFLKSPVINPGFEMGSTGWTTLPAQFSVVSNAADSNSGTHALQMVNAGTGSYANINQTVAVLPNTNYTFSIYAKGPSNGLIYKVTDTSNNALPGTGASRVNGSSTYGKYNLNFNSGNNTSVKLFLSDGGTSGAGTYYVDDVTLTQADLAVNSGLESGDGTGWALGTGFTVSSADKYSGSYSLKFPGTGGWGFSKQTLNVSPGTDYTVSFYAKTNTANSVVSKVLDGNGSPISGASQVYVLPGTSWAHYSYNFNSGSNRKISIYFGEGIAGTSYVDDVTLLPNLIRSPDFEAGNGTGESWLIGTSGGFAISSTDSYHGSYALKIMGNGGYDNTKQDFHVSRNETYTLTIYGKCSASCTKGFAYKILDPSDNSVIGTAQVSGTSTSWTPYTLTFNPGNRDVVRLYLGVNAIPAGQTFYIDGISLQ